MILSNFITIWNDKEFDMDKRDYELLLALDQHKNITKAAQSLYMTQPAITKRIQKMEEELHCPLLIRSKRGVLLTPAAESLLPCARTILKNMEQMEELAAASQDYICGTLRLGCSLNYAHYRLPAILKDYTVRYPKVEVHITTEQSRQLYKMLCKEEISLAILRGEYNWDGKKILLASEPMCLICSREDAGRPLTDYPYISHNTDSGLNSQLFSWFEARGLTGIRRNFQIDSIDTCKEMVRYGLGWSILPSICLNNFDGYTEALFWQDGTPFVRNTYLLCQPTSDRLPQVKKFLELL